MAQYSSGNGSSLSDLERQAETTRAELAQTVDELHSRVSPSALKRDAKDYVRQTGQQVLHTIEERARDNPLAAVAVAAGLAFPLWRMVSRIPAPVLLIGAGVALSRRGSADAGGRDLARSVGEKASDLVEDTRHKAEALGSRVTEAVSGTVESAREWASDAAATLTGSAADMSRHGTENLIRARGSLEETIERHPLLVGGVVFAIGGLLASALPVTRSENRLMGDASDAVKGRARDVADDGMEAVQAAAGEVYEDASARVRSQGLTPETARATARTAMEEANSVIEKFNNPESDNG